MEESSNTADSKESASDTAVTQRKRRKRKKNFIPRVVSNDVRRYYGSMVMNVFNTHDFRTTKSFFRSFAIPSFRVCIRKIDTSHLTHIPEHLIRQHIPKLKNGASFLGDDWLNFHHFIHNETSPDLVFRMTEAKLITRLNDSRSAIIMSTEVEQTQIVDWDPLTLANEAFDFDVEPFDSDDSSSYLHPPHSSRLSSGSSHHLSTVDAAIAEPKVRGTMRSAASAVMRSANSNAGNSSRTIRASPTSPTDAMSTVPNLHKSLLPLLPQPRRVCMSSQLILVINEHKQIETMIAGDGRPPPDLLQMLERQAAAMSLQPRTSETPIRDRG